MISGNGFTDCLSFFSFPSFYNLGSIERSMKKHFRSQCNRSDKIYRYTSTIVLICFMNFISEGIMAEHFFNGFFFLNFVKRFSECSDDRHCQLVLYAKYTNFTASKKFVAFSNGQCITVSDFITLWTLHYLTINYWELCDNQPYSQIINEDILTHPGAD